jgi:peptidoglycan/LPS O-acetylase OafA/YrhL
MALIEASICMINGSRQDHQINNLTALRWLAALLVLYGHSYVLLGLPKPIFLEWVPILGQIGVYIFFAISGYLVSQSWCQDPHVFRFLQRRALRIFPGLVVCTLLSVFVLGPIFTTLDLTTYFANQHTLGYFSNIALYITYHLPGVFANNLLPHAVNGSLWSLPVEFAMYLLLAVLGLCRFKKWGMALVVILFMAANIYWAFKLPDQVVFYRTDLRQLAFCGVYFFVGVALHQFNLQKWFSLSNVCIALVVWLSFSDNLNHFIVASWFFLPFVVMAFGLSRQALLSRLTPIDYSYGIYIYAFPVQQVVASYWPNMPLGSYLLVVGFVTLLLAAASWHWVEKPALAFKPLQKRTPAA